MNAVKKHESPHIVILKNNNTSAVSGENTENGLDVNKAIITTADTNRTIVLNETATGAVQSSGYLVKNLTSSMSSEIHNKSSSDSLNLNADISGNKKTIAETKTLESKSNGNKTVSKSTEADVKPSGGTGNLNKCPWDGKVIENRTLVGGINSGDFKEHSKATTIAQCMEQCCSEQDCDLSFMIDTDCYTVKCSKSDLCETRKAKTTSFKPKIAYKRRPNVVVEVERK